MIVYNINPVGTQPIVIVNSFRRDPEGGPAIVESTYMIGPGDGIDLAILGLEPKKENK